MLIALSCITLTILSSALTNVDVNISNDPELWSIICTIVYVLSAIIAVLFCAISQISIGKYEIEMERWYDQYNMLKSFSGSLLSKDEVIDYSAGI